MNDTAINELKTVVERAVRPVRATMARKRKMREELLAHLVSVFEEEAQHGDEQVALERAKQRFGDVRELSAQIQAAVARSESFGCFTERILLFRKGESALAHSVRIAVSLFLWFAITLVLLPPVLLLRGRLYEIGRLEFACFAAGIAFAAFFFIMTLLGHGVRQALFPRSPTRSLLAGLLYVLSSAPVVPVFGFLLDWIATGDLAGGYAHFHSLCWSIVVVPVVLIAAVWRIVKDAQDDDDWARLEIGE
jgi:hypothetical protein